MPRLFRHLLLPLALLMTAASGATVDYPYPVQRFHSVVQGEAIDVAYMDVAPERPNGRTVLLLHGKNFCSAAWGDTARALAAGGYRVIVPDQLGACRSSKPAAFQYSFHAIAGIDLKLADSLGIGRLTVVGHSMGGMLATRLALLHPERVEQLVLVNPLGLADGMAQGIPYADIDTLRAEEARTTAATIKGYQLDNYYHGQWRPDYDRWVAMQAATYAGADRAAVIAAQARASEMIETQPVAYEFGRLRVPTTLMIGMRDRTAFGRQRAPREIRDAIPAVPALAGQVVRAIPGAQLVAFDDLGHAPQIEAPQRFQAALLKLLARQP